MHYHRSKYSTRLIDMSADVYTPYCRFNIDSILKTVYFLALGCIHHISRTICTRSLSGHNRMTLSFCHEQHQKGKGFEVWELVSGGCVVLCHFKYSKFSTAYGKQYWVCWIPKSAVLLVL